MGMHDFIIDVLERTETKVRIQLRLWEPRSINVSAIQIEAMLFEQSFIPNREVLASWWRTKTAENEWLEIADEIKRVELISGGPEQPWTDADWSIMDMGQVDAETVLGPPFVIEVTVDEPEMLAHLNPGESWKHWDGGFSGGEQYTFSGGPKPPVWKRGRKPKRKAPKVVIEPFGMVRVLSEEEGIVRVEFAALGELPSLSLPVWIRQLDRQFPGLENVNGLHAERHLSAVYLESIVPLPYDALETFSYLENLDPKSRKQPLLATYRILSKDTKWQVPTSKHAPRDAWQHRTARYQYLLHPAKPSEPGALAELQELIELAEMDGPECVAELLEEGLTQGVAVSPWSLDRAAELGPAAEPLIPRIAALIGSASPEVAHAGIACAASLKLPGLEPALELAATRLDSALAKAAQQALEGL